MRDALAVQATEFFLFASEAEAKSRVHWLDDLKFAAGDHWPETIRQNREADNRPCLTIDRLGGPIKQVLNQIRSAKPGIQINPVDSAADVDTAEALQGIIRRIETRSDALAAYLWAAKHQIEMGVGYWRVLTDYVGDSFEQDLKISKILNQFAVYMDPGAQELDASDAAECLIVEDLTHDAYKRRYAKGSQLAKQLGPQFDFQSIGDCPPDWITERFVRVAEYFYTTYEPRTICLLSTGDVIEKPAGKRARLELPDGVTVQAERTIQQPRIKWALLNGLEILDTREMPGKYIPVVRVLGDDVVINGQRDPRGMVRLARDPQRMIDYERSSTVETVALAPRAPFVMAEGQNEGHELMWNTANARNWSTLIYKPTALGGTVLPPPARNFGEPPIQALVALSREFENDLRAATGYFDVQGQEQRPEQSGKAIIARQRQGEVGNSHFIDNLGRAIRQTGRILIDLIPHIYDTPRVLRILGKDDTPQTVMVAPKGQAPAQRPENVDAIFDPSVGLYDVTVTAGRSFETARQENLEMMTAALQANPALFQVIGDLYFAQTDSPIGQQIAARLKPSDEKEIPPEVKAQLEQLQAALQEAMQKIQTDQVKAEAAYATKELDARTTIHTTLSELEMKRDIEFRKLEVELEIELAKLGSAQSMARAELEQQDLHKHSDLQLREQEQQEARSEADLQRQHEADQAERAQQAQQNNDGEDDAA